MSDDLEEIEGVARTGGNLRIQISKALNVGAGKREGLLKTEDLEKIRDLGKTGDPEKRGGGLESKERVILMVKNKTYSKYLKVQQDDRKRNGRKDQFC